MKRIPYSYCIFYIERKYYQNINKELKEKGYKKVRAIIPTINVLKKTAKGKMIFEEVPILFNYGFIKMPTELAYSRPFLNKLKRSISGIRTWLKSTETLHERKKKARIDNSEDFDDFSLVATCTRKDVKRFKRMAKEGKKYLNSQGMIFMEIGYDQGQAVKEIFESEGFVDIVIKKDLCKNDRVVIGRII